MLFLDQRCVLRPCISSWEPRPPGLPARGRPSPPRSCSRKRVESHEDLAKGLARQCVVFNCSDQPLSFSFEHLLSCFKARFKDQLSDDGQAIQRRGEAR